MLAGAATEAGLDAAVIAQLLAGDADRAEVAAEAEAARTMGVTGVPTFILGGQYALSRRPARRGLAQAHRRARGRRDTGAAGLP